MNYEMSKFGKTVFLSLALSAAAYLFFYAALVPFDTDRQFGKAYKPFGVTMSVLFVLFGVSIWFGRYSRRTAIIIFLSLVALYIAGTIFIGSLVGRPDPPYVPSS